MTSMREMIRDILATEVPVIGYVAPPGAQAASAGFFILMSTDIAAMARAPMLGRPRRSAARARTSEAPWARRSSRTPPP